MQAQNDGSSTQVLELLEMPLDILFEVCLKVECCLVMSNTCVQISQHLDPTDILNLGRTSRVTRQLVLSRVLKPVWVHARSRYPGLPDCPDDMNEPAYAELMFGDSCLVSKIDDMLHRCGANSESP